MFSVVFPQSVQFSFHASVFTCVRDISTIAAVSREQALWSVRLHIVMVPFKHGQTTMTSYSMKTLHMKYWYMLQQGSLVKFSDNIPKLCYVVDHTFTVITHISDTKQHDIFTNLWLMSSQSLPSATKPGYLNNPANILMLYWYHVIHYLR
jgi:hypothetical protein